MNDRKYLKLIDKDGKEKKYEILVTFKWKNKNYVVFTDNTVNENNELNVYAAIYYPNDRSRFDPVESNEEWNKIEQMLNNISREII